MSDNKDDLSWVKNEDKGKSEEWTLDLGFFELTVYHEKLGNYNAVIYYNEGNLFMPKEYKEDFKKLEKAQKFLLDKYDKKVEELYQKKLEVMKHFKKKK